MFTHVGMPLVGIRGVGHRDDVAVHPGCRRRFYPPTVRCIRDADARFYAAGNIGAIEALPLRDIRADVARFYPPTARGLRNGVAGQPG